MKRGGCCYGRVSTGNASFDQQRPRTSAIIIITALFQYGRRLERHRYFVFFVVFCSVSSPASSHRRKGTGDHAIIRTVS